MDGDSGSFSFSDNSTGYSPPSSWGLTDTPSTTPTYGDQNSSIPGYNYGDNAGSSGSSSYNPWYQQQDMASAEQALGPDGPMGREALLGNMYEDGRQGPTHNDVDYDALDWLKGNWQKYSGKLGKFGLGVLSRTNPAAATAMTLYSMFNSPRGAAAGQVGGTLGGTIGGAINPALAGVGSLFGSDVAQGAAAGAEGQYGQAANGPTGSQGRTGSVDWGAAGAGLGQIWNRYGASKEYGSQANQLSSLYGPNSPYAQQMSQQLLRADAAKGRRSQVGTRSVELQARLADIASRNAPQLQQLTRAGSDERNKMYADLYSLGRMFD